MNERPTTHPDFGELEAHRRGEAEAATAVHVAGCAECQDHLAEIRALALLVRESTPALPPVPEAIEKRMLWNARRNAARVRRRRALRSVRRWAIAASVLLTAGALVVWRQVNQRGTGPVPQMSLDIVDALAVARRLAAAQPVDARYDVNHDGRVDDADVERITRQAVALGDA